MSEFWKEKTLEQMTDQEWESLCDGCGRCCLQKLECADSGDIFYTELACQLLDLNTCKCGDYTKRTQKVSSCVNLRSLKEHEWNFMPTTCAYRLLKEEQGLMPWHPLITGDHKMMEEMAISVKGKVLPEQSVAEEDFEEHIVTWVQC
jgi:uncharacterized cysteine cluster protein YcgN (CxxCxxCC family)